MTTARHTPFISMIGLIAALFVCPSGAQSPAPLASPTPPASFITPPTLVPQPSLFTPPFTPLRPPEKAGLRPDATPFPRRTPAGMKNLGRLRGLASLHRDLALLCGDSPRPSDAGAVQPDCEAALVESDGSLRALNRRGLYAAQRLPGDRMLFLERNLSLFLRDPSGSEKRVAASVAEPRASEDGSTVVFTQYPPGTERLEPGLAGKLVGMGMGGGTPRVITEDPSASSPFPVPGTEEVIFLSARTGLASIWMASPGKPDRQLTNIGKTEVDGEFTPVYGRELIWIPGSRKAVYTAHYGSHTVWLLDVDTGKARKLGPGRLPAFQEDGTIAAVTGPEESPQIVHYGLTGTP